MANIDPYYLIIGASLILILSYLFGIVAKKTNVPAVLLLIILGIILRQVGDALGIGKVDWFPILQVLGIVGLIMIVLEAALDLELKREKRGLILKALGASAVGLVLCGFAIAAVLNFVLDVGPLNSLLYAIPLSILSSAIVIPSILALGEEKREFLIYESTFSDILGIVFFYLVINLLQTSNDSAVFATTGISIVITILVSLGVSYGIVLVFQNIRSHGKIALLMAVLLLFYGVAKIQHLSALLLILVFGLVINNHKLFFRGFLKKVAREDTIASILGDSKLVTGEAAFVIRTFFFVIFGITIKLNDLVSLDAIIVSVIILVALYFVRFATLRLFRGRKLFPELFIAPRGLITILLFFSIPASLDAPNFNQGILLYVILATSGVMTYALINKDRQGILERLILGQKPAEQNKAEEEGNAPAEGDEETESTPENVAPEPHHNFHEYSDELPTEEEEENPEKDDEEDAESDSLKE